MHEAFPGSDVVVIDADFVSDNKTFMQLMIDKFLITKLEETKLQWHFQKTMGSNFPVGYVKLCFVYLFIRSLISYLPPQLSFRHEFDIGHSVKTTSFLFCIDERFRQIK